MYYRINDDILFRQYGEYGLITDNSEYGYRMLNDFRPVRPEEYVSKSGSVMLSMLTKSPKNIDDIVNDLSNIFIGVDSVTLKSDTMEFFQYFVDKEYLCSGKNYETCKNSTVNKMNDSRGISNSLLSVDSDDCASTIIKKQEFLRSVHIEIANICNERCVHCYIPHKYKTDVMDSNLFYRIVEDGRKMNIIHVTLSGGEPLLHPNIIEFLRKCRRLDLSVNVLSNLTALSDEIIDEMKNNPLLSVQTSIYSMNSSVHDKITKLKGSLEKTISGVKKLILANIPLQISCPVMKQNKDDFDSVIKWGFDNNISVAIEPVIFASYDHSGENLTNRLSLEEVEKAFDCELAEGYAETIYKQAIEKEALKPDDPICSICRYSICIAANGDVYPCVGWQSNIIGTLKTDSLKNIWENSEKIECLRKIKRKDFPMCVNCKNSGYCTVCMMCNSNENNDGDSFSINEFRCRVAEMKHNKIIAYFENKSVGMGFKEGFKRG